LPTLRAASSFSDFFANLSDVTWASPPHREKEFLMSNRPRPAVALCAALALALSSVTAVAAPYLPLVAGRTWMYQGDQGGHQTETMTGTTTLHGRTVWVKHYYEGVDAGLENFWLLAFDGGVLLAGFHSPAGYGFVYEPPIRYLPVPPVLGDQPFQPIAYHDFATDALLFSGAVRFDVLEDVSLVLPAGTYHSFGVGQYVPLPGPAATGARLTLDGRVVTSTGKSIAVLEPTDWFSEGVGIVMYNVGQIYQLESLSGPTPTAMSSWAAIKRLYR
jgi:hypothetical protein